MKAGGIESGRAREPALEIGHATGLMAISDILVEKISVWKAPEILDSVGGSFFSMRTPERSEAVLKALLLYGYATKAKYLLVEPFLDQFKSPPGDPLTAPRRFH